MVGPYAVNGEKQRGRRIKPSDPKRVVGLSTVKSFIDDLVFFPSHSLRIAYLVCFLFKAVGVTRIHKEEDAENALR